jgi:NADH-quinone oxidoreductase subunit L
MGGLRKLMPTTFATYVIGSLALAGLFPLAGFWSKDDIINGAYQSARAGSSVGWFVFLAALLTAFLTAAYVARMIALTFFGEAKYDPEHVHPHESPKAMTVPLVILAFMAIVSGFVGLPGKLNLFAQWVHFGDVEHAFNLALDAFSTVLALSGLYLGWTIFGLKKVRIDLAKSPLAWFYKLLQRRYYFDELYFNGIVHPISGPIARAAYWTNQKVLDAVINFAGAAAVSLGKGLYNGVDQPVIDGAVNGLAQGAGAAGNGLKFWQTGNVQIYAAGLFVGIAVFVGVFLVRG